jgi:glutamate 5-kinase
MLVTLDDLEDRRRYLNIAATLDRLLGASAVPVINENDSVATEEIRFGDNDRLAARVAQAAAATGVLLLSDVDGLYDAHPGSPGAQIVPVVARIDASIRAMVAAGSSSGMGSGGMASKLDAAEIATRAGIPLALISGVGPHPLRRFAQGGPATVFLAKKGQSARKNWLGGRLTARGQIHIDDGAAQALGNGSSLLPAGAVSVSGAFRRGDVVDILCGGVAIARGLSEYDATDAAQICQKRTADLERILGEVPRNVLVHRDQLVLL